MNTHALTSCPIRFAILILCAGFVFAVSLEVLAQSSKVPTTATKKKVKRSPAKPRTNIVSGGVLNSKALSLPQPVNPFALTKSAPVVVQVTVDEAGEVISAVAISGHALLRASSVAAAREATFNPTKLNGRLVKVTGTLVYEFAPRNPPELVDPSSGEPVKKATIISGGILNGKAVSLPQPIYPPVAKAAHASGTVVVQITVDEEGNVISSVAVSGHPLLKAAAVSAARGAKFAPTRLSGVPAKVTGTLHYNFVPAPDQTPETSGPVAQANSPRNSQRRAPSASRSTQGCPLAIDSPTPVSRSKIAISEIVPPPIWFVGSTVPVGPPPAHPIVVEDEPPPIPPPAPIDGGILNSRAISMPRPAYPPVAKAAHASGLVTIKVTVDESGNVSAATAVSGHPLLKAAAVGAARGSRFNPTLIEGKPVRVSGVLLYEFIAD